jgi:protein TonB
VAPHSRDDRLGAYVSAWLRKVERVGNNNYPEEARRRGIHGAVRVEAVLRPDGSLAGVRILESSGEEVLDEAARRIIRLGAPYAPLGPELGRRLDRLHIPHRFVFTEGDPLRATP